jgi:hypothetical protein
MTSKPRTVFVLGAGFTKAFIPTAPLLVDTYKIDTVISKYRGFPNVAEVIQGEKDRHAGPQIDIERLLTRLEGLPFDTEETLVHFVSVKRDVNRLFLDRLEDAKREALSIKMS